MESILNRRQPIENEFQEPLRDIVAGFIPLGMTRPEVAETLEVNPRSLRTYCEREEIHFPRNQSGRRERIRESSRRGNRARLLSMDGETYCLTGWAELYSINPDTLRTRLRRGKNLRQALRA